LTKLDLMDEGTNAKDILLNNDIKLKHGYVGVKGRSQGDIIRNTSVKDAIRNELDYFGKHPIYSSLPTEILGTRSLVNRISELLYKMID
jgi:replication fork clamp-binding protein CrfC